MMGHLYVGQIPSRTLHPQGDKDVFLAVFGKVLAADDFNQVAEQAEPDIGISPGAGRYFDRSRFPGVEVLPLIIVLPAGDEIPLEPVLQGDDRVSAGIAFLMGLNEY